MTNASKASELKLAINEIADQLSLTIDDDFDVHVKVDSDEIEVQKLCVLTNFLLENVRRNISELQELSETLEEKASERTRRLDLVISGSNDGVWMWDLATKHIEYSGQWLQMLGLDSRSSDSTPSTWFDRVHPKDQPDLQAAIRAHLDGITPNLNAEYRIRHANGLYRWMMCRGMTYRNETGTAELFAGTQTDITNLRGVDLPTGLPNENYFNEVLEDFLDSQRGFYVGLLRVARLHILTETLDGPTMDKLRKDIAGRIIANSPMDAILARLNGDVFAIILPSKQESGIEEVHKLCANLKAAFTKSFYVGSSGEQGFDISIGFTEMSGECNLSSSEVLGSTWTALRNAGRKDDQLCIYDLQAREHAFQILRLERELRPALKRGMFEAHLQPIVSMADETVCGYEALMRLNHHEMGMVPPDEFIPLAEDSGLMKELGENILRQSIEGLSRLLRERDDAGHVYVSVNVSPVQLASVDFAESVESILSSSGLSPNNLRLEVTETAIMKNMDIALEVLKEVRKKGIKISLDDFGTGYSSLSYLRRLPVDVLKIDRSFVTQIDQPSSKRAIVETVFGLARLLSLDVVAEGIETAEEYKVLQGMGIQYGQGYLFGKPREIFDALENHHPGGLQSNRFYQLKKA